MANYTEFQKQILEQAKSFDDNRKKIAATEKKKTTTTKSSTSKSTTSQSTKNAASSIKTETVKKTESTKKSGTYSKKTLPKSTKTLPKESSSLLEGLKKALLGSSYVSPNGTKNTYDANPYTQAKQDKFWQGLSTEKGVSGTFGRILAGIGEGFVDANTSLPSFVASKVTGKDVDLKEKMGLSLPKSAEALQDTTSYKVGELGGNLLGYGAQNIAAAPAIDALLTGTKLGQTAANAGTKLANTKIGQLAGEEAMQNLTAGLARNAVEAGTVGLGQNIGMAAQEGLQGEEFLKDVALNTALDLGVGSALEAIPAVTSTIKGAKKARTAADWLNERNAAKSVGLSDIGKLDGEEVIETSKKVATTTNNKPTAVAAEDIALPKKSKSTLRKTENPVSKAEKAKAEAKELKADAEAEYERYYEEARQKVEKYISEYKGQGSQTHLVPKNEDSTGAAVRHTVSNNDPWYSKALKEYGNNAGVNRNAKELSERLLDEDLRLAKGQQEMIDGETWQYLHDMKDLVDKQDDIINRNVKKSLPKSRNGKELKPGGADVLKADMSVEEIAQKYGTYKGGKVPKATDMGDVSQGANTLYYSEIMDDKAKEALLDGVKAGDYWKTTVKNRIVISEAKEAVSKDIDSTLDSFLAVSKSGKQATSRDIAKGYALAEEYIKKGDYATVENVLADVAMMESEAGRTLQAMRIFRSQSPAGRVKSALKSVQKIEADRGVKITVNQKLLDDVMNATTDAEKLVANKAFATDVWNQVPATLGEKLNSWRYLSMLGNPKTHIRNVLGNAIFVPARVISDSIATGMEKALGKKIAKLGGDKSKAIVGYTGSDGELRKLAKSEFKAHSTAIESASSKYIEAMRPQDAKLYKGKILEGLRKANYSALEKEDQIFMGLNFESAFSQYCKANGKTASEVTGKFRDEAIAYAERRALESTYRDPNALASAISKFKRNFNIKKTDSTVIKFGKKAGEIVSESVLPFVKTPANILKRGVEYSPGGVIAGISKLATAKDAETFRKGIEYFSSGLTGTGVMIAGYYAAKRGFVSGGSGEYDKVKAYEQMLGSQDYAVTVGDKTFTIDWMAPMSMPFFVGVEVAGAESGDRDLWETIEAMSTITDPLFEMSMLSGIDTVFDTAFSDGSPIVNIAKNAMQNYVSQYIPTLSGQIARTITKERKTTLSTANSGLERWANKGLDKLTNKIPGLTELNQPYVDQWGRTDSKKTAADYAWSAVENLLSPGYISEKNQTAVDKEIARLYGELSEEDAKGVIPAISSSAYKVKYNGNEYTMTESEFTEYKKTVGQYRYSELQKLFNTKEYKTATVAEKRKMIMDVYESGTEKGKESYLVGTKKTTTEEYAYSTLSASQQAKVDESGVKATEMKKAVEALQKANAGNGKSIQKAYALDGFSSKIKSAYGLSDKAINSANELKNLGIEYNEFEETAGKIDTNNNGGYTVEEITAYLNSTNKYTRQQKAAIFAALSSAKYNPYL